jgi:hypothetical protein
MAQPTLPLTAPTEGRNTRHEALQRIAESVGRHHTPHEGAAIDSPSDAAEQIVPMFRTMLRGIVLLLLDAARRPLVGLAVHDAPRNEFEPVVDLLASLTTDRPHAVILGVLSHEAVVEDQPYVFGENVLATTDRLAVDAATVHAWAEFSCRLEEIDITLLDVIECTPWSWASVHAPAAPYLRSDLRLGERSSRGVGGRQARASAAR